MCFLWHNKDVHPCLKLFSDTDATEIQTVPDSNEIHAVATFYAYVSTTRKMFLINLQIMSLSLKSISYVQYSPWYDYSIPYKNQNTSMVRLLNANLN